MNPPKRTTPAEARRRRVTRPLSGNPTAAAAHVASPRVLVAMVLLASFVLAVAFVVRAAPASAAPGVPAAPTSLYKEDFEDGGPGITSLASQPGDNGATYTADAYWLSTRDCNGFVLSFSIAWPGAAYCGDVGNFNATRYKAYALGLLNAPQTPTTNRALSSNTSGPPSAVPIRANLIQFATVGQVSVPGASGRFVTFSVDAAATACPSYPAPLLRFYLRTDAGAEVPVSTSAINPCTDPRRQTTDVPTTSPGVTAPVSYGSFPANSSVRLAGSSLGVVLRNESGVTAGNDGAIDNIRILDVTPTLDKAFGPSTVTAGERSTLTFTITNTTDLAEKDGWAFTDTLPSGLKVADPAGASTTCSGAVLTAPAGSTSVRLTGNLDAGQTSCTATVDVTSPTAGTFTNGPSNMTLTSLKPPQSSTVVFQAADLAVEKSAVESVATPGLNLTYGLKATNNGPGTARAVRISDPLPAGVEFVSASPDCSYAAGPREVTCTPGDLGDGASRDYQVVVRVPSSSTATTLVNTATVSSTTPDPDSRNNTSDPVRTPVQPSADLSIVKTASTATPAAGEPVVYTLNVKNDGPSDATGVTVADPGGPGLTLVKADAGQGTCAVVGGRVSCDLGSMVSGTATQVRVTADVAFGTAPVANAASVLGGQPDPATSNNGSTATITPPAPPLIPPTPEPAPPLTPSLPPAAPPVVPRPVSDLVVTKSVSTANGRVGEPLTYTIRVRNDGPDATSATEVVDAFGAPARVRSVRTSQGTCTVGTPLRCALGGLANGATATIVVVAVPTATGELVNTATVSSPSVDPQQGTNRATARSTVRGAALRITKTADRRTVPANGAVRFRLRVTNPSDATAHDVRVCDRLPAGLVPAGASRGARLIKGLYCWTIPRLGAGKSAVRTITARAVRGASGPMRTVATVQAADRPSASARRSVTVVRPTAIRAGGVTG